METHRSLESLSTRHKVLSGISIALVGLVVSALMIVSPEKLRVPLWVGLAAAGCFIIAGLAVAIHSFVSRKIYAWCMVLLLALMTGVPGWIAFGPGQRECTASISLLSGESACRWAFGFGALVSLFMALAAARAAMNIREN